MSHKRVGRKCDFRQILTQLYKGAITSAYYRDLLECISDSVKYQKKYLGRYFEASNYHFK